jgi:hypothetical protein
LMWTPDSSNATAALRRAGGGVGERTTGYCACSRGSGGVLDVDNLGLQIQWSETSNAADFSQNLTRARCEGPFGTSARSPLGVVSCDLTA